MFNFKSISTISIFSNILLMKDKNLIKSYYDPFKSKILNGNQAFSLVELCEFNYYDKWTLMYRGTEDGFGAKEFHLKCDGKSSTLTIAKSKMTGYVFGGFTFATWQSCSGLVQYWKADPNAFLFSLINKDRQPCKIMTSNPADSIYCDIEFGPVFGNLDLCFLNELDTTTMDGYSCLNRTYKLPEYVIEDPSKFLTGAYKFQLSEIEVYQKI